MTKIDYLHVETRDIQAELKKQGLEGWDLINVSETLVRGCWRLIFKRPHDVYMAGV